MLLDLCICSIHLCFAGLLLAYIGCQEGKGGGEGGGGVGGTGAIPMEAVRPEVRRATTSFCMVPAGRHSLAAITTYSAKQPPDRVATGCPISSPALHPNHSACVEQYFTRAYTP